MKYVVSALGGVMAGFGGTGLIHGNHLVESTVLIGLLVAGLLLMVVGIFAALWRGF